MYIVRMHEGWIMICPHYRCNTQISSNVGNDYDLCPHKKCKPMRVSRNAGDHIVPIKSENRKCYLLRLEKYPGNWKYQHAESASSESGSSEPGSSVLARPSLARLSWLVRVCPGSSESVLARPSLS